MPYDKIDQLYDALKADGAVSKDRNNFRNVMLAPGKDGYQNRKRLFDALKADGAVDSSSYEEFAQRLGLHAVKPAERKVQQTATPMTAAEREEFVQGAHEIAQQAQGAQRRMRNVVDYAKGNTGLHAKPVKLGQNKNVVERAAVDPVTGKMRKNFLTETGAEYENRKTADLEQNAIDDYKERVLHPIESELNDAYAERDRLAKMASGRGEALDNTMPAVAFGAGQAMTSGSIHRMSDEEYRQWQAATAANNERIKTLEAQRDKDKAGFWRGFADSTTDPNTWLFGIPGLADTAPLYATAQKVKNGQRLTESEKALLDNTIANRQAHGKYDGERGFLYRAGQISAQALPFVAEFLATGGFSGIADIGAKAGSRAAAKYGTNAASKWLIKNTGVLAGDVAAGWAMANTTGAAKTATDVFKRNMGQVSVDGSGAYKLEDGKSIGRSLWEGEAAQTLEYYTERLGEHLQIGNWLAKGAEKLGLSKLSKAINYMSTNKWLEKGGVQDYPSEVFEEEANIVLNAMLAGDNSISDLWDGKTQADIWGGMALSVGMMNVPKYAGTGYQTAQYYRYKHATDKAARVAGYQIAPEKWKPLQETIDGTTNDNMADVVSGIMSDTELRSEDKKAAADYAYNLLKMRGYNMGLMNATKDEVDSGDQADHSADESFTQGYDSEGSALTDAKTAYELQHQKIAEKYGEDTIAYADDNPVGYLHQLKEQGADEETQADFLAYINAKSAFDGVIQRAQDDLDDRITESSAMIDSRTHRQDGGIHPATMKYKDRKVYVVSGNVVMTDDGSMVDTAQSDNTLIIRDAETGEVEFADPGAILSVDETIDPEEEKASAAETITQTFGKERADQIDGVLSMQQGDTYNIVDDEGKPHTVQVVQNNGDGSLAVTLDDAQEAIPMTAEQLQTWADNANVQRVRQQEEEAATALHPAKPEAETENGLPTYSINDEITLRGEDGLPVRGSVGAEENADGLIEVYTESPVNGKRVNMFTREELDSMLMQYNGEDVDAGGEVGGTGTAESPQANTDERSLQEGVETAAQTVAPMPMTGEGEDAEPDFSRVAPARAHTYIYNEAGLNRNEGDAFVAANLKEAQKALEKAKKGEPKMGTSIAKYKKEQAAYQQIVDGAQRTVDYWNGVKAEQDKIVAEESRMRAEQQAAETRQAIGAELQRKEEEARKATEQAEVGTHNVAPAIKEKWDAVPKVEGAANEIVLPNGEKVAGHYVLVESGAASPSHNATNEFTKTEGFPIDENGQSVNGRDYERDKDAQRITREIAGNYDSRALQSPVVVSKDGIVLSGNGRTMAGELAAANNTDGAYIEHLQKYPQQYGFTPEQVQGMDHPRVLFVPDADMPYTAETFAKYNQQEMKGQSKTEHAVKLGKVVDDATFNRIIRLMNQYDTLGDFYADSKATHDAIGELQTAGVVAPAQVAEMFDGDGISAQGREMLENMLIGKAFESNPDAVRQITAFKSMRQSVITALAEISNNKALGDGYSLEKELADAIALVYNARNDKYKAGERVSEYARQGNLFQLDDGATVADFTNATTMMLADVLNDNRSTQLRKILAVYNHKAADSAVGQMDMFSGGVLTKRDILNEVKQLINYGTEQQQTEAIGQAVERRKAESIQQDGDTRGSGKGSRIDAPVNDGDYTLSDKKAENGERFYQDANGSIDLADIPEEVFDKIGKPKAPFRLTPSMLKHVFDRHGKEMGLSQADDAIDFVLDVMDNFDHVRQGAKNAIIFSIENSRNRTGRRAVTILLDSNSGEYYGIKTSGYERIEGLNKKPLLWEKGANETSATGVAPANVTTKEAQQGNGPTGSASNHSTGSASKDSKSSEIKQKYEDIFAKAERIARESEVKRKITEAEKETDVTPTEGQKEAGNYKKGHVTVDGLDVTIEQPKGSVRRGKDADGKEWESEMHNTYGYIKGTEGVDGDHIDIFLSDNPASGHVFVIDQVNPKTGEFDEHKVMYGFPDAESAKQAYLSNYEDGWQGLGSITEVSKNDFKKWIDSSKRKTKPFAEYAAVKTQSANRVENKSSKDLSKSEKDVSLQSKSSEYENSRRNSQGTGRNRPKKLGENDAIGLRLESAGRESEKANGGSLGERIERERAAAEKFAAEHGALMSIDDLFSLGDIGPSGTESDTYFSRDGYVYKMNNLMHNPLVSDYLKRLSFHNKIFTNTPYELVGFVKSGKSLYPVVRQESVDFDRQGTKEEISSYMQSLGFVDDGEGVFHNNEYTVKDVKPKNVFKGKDGQLYVVDAEISEKANSPEVKQKKEDEVSEIPAMTEAEYLASKGLGSPMTDYMLDKMRIPHGETARQRAKRNQKAEKAMEEHAAQKEAARKEYREKIANGELREPTKDEAEQKRIDALVKTANGHDDNPSVQAARRVLDKRGIEWKKNEDIFTRAERIAQDVANKKELEKREPTKAGKIPQEEKEDLLSQKEYVDNGMSSALEQTQYKTLEEWEDKDTEDYARKYDDFLADYTNYINDFANGEKLQALYDKSSVKVQKEIRRHIEDAGLDYHDILDTSPGRIRIQDRLTKKMKYAKGEFSDGTIVAGEVVSQTPTSLVINSRGRKYTIKAGSVLEQSDEPIASGGVLFRDGGQEYTEEEREVIANAKADGSYMKAPNGKSTKLTEHQWAQVRTKAFKEWFGDWEKTARIEKLRKSKAVKITGDEYKGKYELERKSAKEWIKGNLRGEYVNQDTGEMITISKVGANKVTSHSMGNDSHLRSIAAIPQLIKNAIFIEERPNEKDNDKYDSYRYYVCGLKIGSVDYTVKLTIGVKHGNKYYDHALTEIEKGKLLNQVNGKAVKSGFTTTGDAPLRSSALSDSKDSKLFSILQTNSSKVLDENGEPMVVYHGTLANGLHQFNKDFIGSRYSYDDKGFFFISNENIAKDYATSEFNASRKGGVIDAYLSLRNPLVVDSDWCKKNGLGNRVFENNDVIEFWDNYQSLLIEESEKNDGVIITDGKTTMAVAFEPNQIKSATDNNGEFDTENDDIRFRSDEVKDFAEAHHLDIADVAAYEYAMTTGKNGAAHFALSIIRRKHRMAHRDMKLSEFGKMFSKIRKGLYEQFGDLDALDEAYRQKVFNERGLMEAARRREEEKRKRLREPIEALMSLTSEERDAEYMRALEAKDEGRMREVLQAEAELKGYSTDADYQGEGTWNAPANPGYKTTEERRAAVEEDSPDLNIDDLAHGYTNQPEDIFTNLRAYGNDNESGRESGKAITDAIRYIKSGKGMPKVTVYRAVPTSVKENSLRSGDWVTPSKAYAKMHGESRLEGDYRIIEQKVPADELWWDSNDIREWGFDNGKDYAYKNTENGRKLNDLVTKDDNGNVIPPSKRFNDKVADERFRTDGGSYTAKQREAYDLRQRRRIQDAARETASKLGIGDRVTMMETADGLTGRRAKAKGWFDTETGKIVVVLGNHRNREDVMQTILHEGVAHYGLRQLFGSHFDIFLDNVFQNADEEVRRTIVEMTANNGWDFRTATEEYLAKLAENTDFERAMQQGWWQRIKQLFLNMLHKIGFDGFTGVELSDNELRYILWRSYENLTEPGHYRSILGQAADIDMQSRLKVGNYEKKEFQQAGKAAESRALFRSGEERGRAMVRDEYNRMLDETSHKFTEAWTDSMVSLKKLQDAIAKSTGNKIEDWENAYMAENAMSSTSQAEINTYKATFFKDLVDAVNKLADESSYEDVVKYVMAKHGLERNEKMAERDFNAYIKENPNGTKTIDYFRNRDYSGLTALTDTNDVVDAEMMAAQMVEDFEEHHNVAELWQAVNAATKATLVKSYESGLIKKPEYEHIRDMFDYYVPLRGFDETTGDEVYNYFGGAHGAFNAPIKAAKGRKSLADDPFATIGNMAESAIMQGNRNKMKQKFLNLVLNHPSDAVSVNELYLKYDAVSKEWNPVFADNILPDDDADTVEKKISDFNERMEQLVEQDAGNYKRGRDAVDIPYRVLGRQLNEHQVHVKKNGRDYVLTINGNPEAAQALNGQTNPDSTQNPFYKAFKGIKNFMAAMFTQKNPAFLLGNLSRDAFYANSMVWVKEGANYAISYNRNWGKALAHLGKLIYKQKTGTLDRRNPLENMFYQFIMHGGETGYTFMNSVDDYKDTIANMIKESRRSGWNPKTWIKFLDNQIDYLGRWAEDASRFAAYMTSREMGRSVERSVWDAKEITVNFNKKGAGAKAAGRWEKGNLLNVLQAWTAQSANELYIFWNAGVQGLSNIARAGKAHPGKLTAMAMTYFAAGTLLPMLQSAIASAMGGDDDEYYNLPEWVRRSNLCIYTPNGWVTIPLPIELRAFYGLGELLQGQMSDATNYHSDELTTKALEQVSQLLPIDFMEGGGGTMAFVPSYAKPFVENAVNKDWTGIPIYKKSDYNKNMPEWTKAYKSTSPELVALARQLNEISGGDKYTKGKIDVNPAEIEYLFEGYLGGLGSFVNQTKKTMMMPFNPNLREMRNVPIANKFFKAADERTKDRRITEEYYRYLDEYEKTAQKVSGYTREAKNGIAEYAEKIDFLFNSPEYERYQIVKGYKSSIDKIGQSLKAAPDDETRAELEGAIAEIRKEAVDVLRATEQ